jgi:hypothetical protein
LTDRFRRCRRDLGRDERAAPLKSLLELDRALEDPHGHRGTGLRKLPNGVWELRVGLALRALFYLEKEEATFLFLGTHDEARRFLRNA